MNGVVLFLLYFMQNNLQIKSEYTASKPPNIVLIVANQLGLQDFALYKDKIPHIRRLVDGSLNFSHTYSHLYPPSSRAALLTGRLPVKNGMLKGRFLPFTSLPSLACSGGMPESEETLAEVLQNYGYFNKFIGLWDLGLGKNGRFLPLEQGFQSWFGILALPTDSCASVVANGASHKHLYDEVALFLCLLLTLVFSTITLLYFRYLKPKYLLYCFAFVSVVYATNPRFHGISYIKVRSCVLFRDSFIIAQPYDAIKLTVKFTEEAVQFINQTALTQSPFFLMVNNVEFSKPLFSSRVFEKNDSFLDSLLELDWSVGTILRTIEDVNEIDNTLVIFTALSGLNYETMESNKDEYDSWERNIKVPLFMKWSERFSGVINTTVGLMDIMPTILDLVSHNYFNEKLDGKSLIPAITNMSESVHDFFYHYHEVTRPSAVTYGKYKAFFSSKTDNGRITHDPPLLYDLSEDPDEISPLPTEQYQHIIETISEAVEKHLENRTRKWISQFEYPILPWLFPCADFPYCYKPDNYKTNMKFD